MATNGFRRPEAVRRWYDSAMTTPQPATPLPPHHPVLDRRPASYFDVPDVVRAIANIKGTRRKEVAMEHLVDGRLALLDSQLLAESLEGDVHGAWTGVHPSFFGGEALPDALPGEVEIARVVLQADPDARGEAISARARPAEAGGVVLRVVDEHERAYALERAEVPEPLSLRELVALLDSARRPDLGADGIGLVDRFRAGRVSDGELVDRILGFVRPISVFYPALAAHLDDRADDWLAGLATRWQMVRRIEGIAQPAPTLAVLGGGRSLAVGSGAHLLFVDAERDAPTVAVAAHEGAVTALAVVAGREALVTGGADGRVRVWAPDGAALAVMGDDGPAEPVTAVAASGATAVVAVGRGADAAGALGLWDLETGDALGALPAEGPVGPLAFLAGGEQLVAVDAEGLRVWDVDRAAARLALPWAPQAVAAAPRGGWFAAADGAVVRVLDAASGSVLREHAARRPSDPTLPSRGLVAAVADGRTLALADGDAVVLWDLVTGQERQVLDGLPGPPLALSAALDAHALAASFADGTVWLWRLVVGAG